MNSQLLFNDEAKAHLKERIRSKEWWIIVNGGGFSVEVEDTYYSEGDATADCEVLLCASHGVLGIALFHKRRMSAAQLSAILMSYGAVPEDLAGLAGAEDADQQDIISPEADALVAFYALMTEPS